MTQPRQPGERSAHLADGSTLAVRCIEPGDVDGLAALYGTLSDDDQYLRFFSAHRADRAFFENMVTVGERGGVALVAELTDGAGRRLVGDAWYALLPNGDGELAITVAPDSRGWLGAYLLDALLEAAGARGVRNLEAEILVRNGPMMALVRNRGFVTIGDDGSSHRVALGASERLPGWAPNAKHPRVLVEAPGGCWRAQDDAMRAGMEVAVCPGPKGRSSARCPALNDGSCPLADDADAIVVTVPLDDGRTRELIESHLQHHPGVPIFVPRPRDPATPLPSGVHVLPWGADPSEVVSIVRAAVPGDAAVSEGEEQPQ